MSTIKIYNQTSLQSLLCSDGGTDPTNCTCTPIPYMNKTCKDLEDQGYPGYVEWCGGSLPDTSGTPPEPVCRENNPGKRNPGASDQTGFLVCAPPGILDAESSCPPLGSLKAISVDRINGMQVGANRPAVCTGTGDDLADELKRLVNCTYDVSKSSKEAANSTLEALSAICKTPPCALDSPWVSYDEWMRAQATLRRLSGCGGDGQKACDTFGDTLAACDPSRGGVWEVDGFCRSLSGEAKYGEICGSKTYGAEVYVRECEDPWKCEGGHCTGLETCAQDLHTFGCASDQGKLLNGFYCQPDFGKQVAWQCFIPETLLASWKCPRDTHLCRIAND